MGDKALVFGFKLDTKAVCALYLGAKLISIGEIPDPTMVKPKLVEQVFEARFEKGYRFLDRCGEALLILEDMLPTETSKVWLMDQATPTGAKLKCPELDVTVMFDAAHLTVAQLPTDEPFDLSRVSQLILATISGRFDIRNFTRLGCRQIYLLATDSADQAQELSVKHSPFDKQWPIAPVEPFKSYSCEATAVFEDDRGSGYRFTMRPAWRVEAPLQVDSRLLTAPRNLHIEQNKVLKDQLRRQALREKSPVAGLVLDVDYYSITPEKLDVARFVADAVLKIELILKGFGRS